MKTKLSITTLSTKLQFNSKNFPKGSLFTIADSPVIHLVISDWTPSGEKVEVYFFSEDGNSFRTFYSDNRLEFILIKEIDISVRI